MILNKDQRLGHQKILDFIQSDYKFFLLEGVGGTGKTTLISEIFKQPVFENKKIVFSATTNKAVSVLENYSKLERKNVSYLTIQKLLKIKRKINESGKEIYSFAEEIENKYNYRDKKSIKNFDIIIIDESSMIRRYSSKFGKLYQELKVKLFFGRQKPITSLMKI